MSETLLLVSPNCPGCEVIKERLKRLGIEKTFRVLDVTTEEGAYIAQKLGVTHVPDCIIVEETKEGRRARNCTETEFLQMIKKK